MVFNSFIQYLEKFPVMKNQILGNSFADISAALILFILLFLVFKFILFVIISRVKSFAKKTKTNKDDLLADILSVPGWNFFILFSAYISLHTLTISSVFSKWLNYFFYSIILYYLVKIIFVCVDYVRVNNLEKKDSSGFLDLWIKILKGLIWVIAVLVLLANMGVDITSVVATLGIGGIAIALALQNVLSDIFASLSIHFDKPFKVGHFIIVGKDMGVVKKIGIKSTRIESLWGEEIVISNQELTSTRINNYKFMEKRRVHFKFGVTYNTGIKKLKKINSIVTEIIDGVKDATLDRTNFKEFGDSSLNYEVAYYVASGNYNEYMNIQEDINMQLVELFTKEKISFAFPTRTVYIEK